MLGAVCMGHVYYIITIIVVVVVNPRYVIAKYKIVSFKSSSRPAVIIFNYNNICGARESAATVCKTHS